MLYLHLLSFTAIFLLKLKFPTRPPVHLLSKYFNYLFNDYTEFFDTLDLSTV